MGNYQLEDDGTFSIADFQRCKPFTSFLPGIAGLLGVPLWVFYVNRGQAITSFGIENKDHPIMEFQPANKAYLSTPLTGFRTFLKLNRGKDVQFYEPFSSWRQARRESQVMHIRPHELELEETSQAYELQTTIRYFNLPQESFAGLVRQVSLTNLGTQPVAVDMLDGMPALIPYGVSNTLLKELNRTIEAWMEVYNLDKKLPYYRLRATVVDTEQVGLYEAGHFALAFNDLSSDNQLLPVLVDPLVVFGQDTSFFSPEGFNRQPLPDLLSANQITCGRTPCAFFAAEYDLASGQSVTLNSLYGHVPSQETIQAQSSRLAQPGYFAGKRAEVRRLIDDLTGVIATRSGHAVFDAYCRQTFLDNVVRGGWPVILSDRKQPRVYHVYSRRHGDPERDYNAFSIAPEYYSQGNGAYRDINQNRRNDVLFNPEVGDFNIRTFISLIQADGYNPLVIQGSKFTLTGERRDKVLASVKDMEWLEAILAVPFTPGRLIAAIIEHKVGLRLPLQEFLEKVFSNSTQHTEASFGEGYWIDHWIYNLDLIEKYLSVFPERQEDLLFGRPDLPFYESPYVVLPRLKKYVLADGVPHQLGSVVEDKEKAAQIAARTDLPKWLRCDHGLGDIYRTTLFNKLVCLALVKFSSLDPWGMGIEMEAGKPGWYDALNGLPALFGSSLPETYELRRLLIFLRKAIKAGGTKKIRLPVEVAILLRETLAALDTYNHQASPNRDFIYWDAVSSAREAYREAIRLGLNGEEQSVPLTALDEVLTLFQAKIQAGIERGVELNHGLPPTYFIYRVEEFETLSQADGETETDPQGRPYIFVKRFKPEVLPLFLEGIVQALKNCADLEVGKNLHQKVKASPLFDRELQMYKVNASLAELPQEIGRARAFTPGWLENESIWLHMEYKYLLEILQAGLYEEFFADLHNVLVPFMAPDVYGRSLLENSSFIVSSAHRDQSLHGTGFVGRLSGSTAEFLSIWTAMMAGKQPFSVQDGGLVLRLRPVLPGWLFSREGDLTFKFLGCCDVTYHNPGLRDLKGDLSEPVQTILANPDGTTLEINGGEIAEPYASMLRSGQIANVAAYYG
jgi:hypothetical protein